MFGRDRQGESGATKFPFYLLLQVKKIKLTDRHAGIKRQGKRPIRSHNHALHANKGQRT